MKIYRFSRVLDRLTCSHITYITFWVCKECFVFWFLEKFRLGWQARIKQIYVAKFHENMFSFSRVVNRITCCHITYTTFWLCKECFVFWFLVKLRLCWQNWIKQIYFAKFHENLFKFSLVLDRITCSHITYTTFWVDACAWNEMTAVRTCVFMSNVCFRIYE